MAAFQFDIDALNDILADNGQPGGYVFEIDALNALAVYLGGDGGHQFNIDALNEIVGLRGGSGNYRYNQEATNEIARLLGGASDFNFQITALNEIADLSFGPHIALSGSHSQAEGTSTNTTIGTFSVVGTVLGTYTFAETTDTDNVFTVASGVLKNSAVFDYETATSHSITVTGTSDNGADPVLVATFVIAVTDVVETANRWLRADGSGAWKRADGSGDWLRA